MKFKLIKDDWQWSRTISLEIQKKILEGGIKNSPSVRQEFIQAFTNKSTLGYMCDNELS